MKDAGEHSQPGLRLGRTKSWASWFRGRTSSVQDDESGPIPHYGPRVALTLGLVVLVRTFLSFSLEIELEGALPRRAEKATDRVPQG
jgi:hypothetical protein